MRCQKCGYITFDWLEKCGKCGAAMEPSKSFLVPFFPVSNEVNWFSEAMQSRPSIEVIERRKKPPVVDQPVPHDEESIEIAETELIRAAENEDLQKALKELST